MNRFALWFVFGLAVWPVLGAADTVVGARAGVAAIERDSLAGASSTSAGDWAFASGLEPESNDRPQAKASLRKGSRRGSQPRPMARSNPASISVLTTGRHCGRPRLVPTVRLAAAADLPRFCRWLL